MAVQEPKSIPQVATELWELTRDYAKQETIDPLKGLGRFLMYGVPGSLCIGAGLSLIALGCLRALQTETGTTFTGNWSWAPYVIVLIGSAIVAGLFVWWISKGGKKEKEPR